MISAVLRCLVVLLAATVLGPPASTAQSSDSAGLSILLAQAALRQGSLTDPLKHWKIEVQFSSSLLPANLPTPQTRFELFDLTSGQAVTTVSATPAPTNLAVTQSLDFPHILEITLPPDALDSSHSYVLYGVGFLAAGHTVEDLHAKLRFLNMPAPPSSAPAPIAPQARRPTLHQGIADSRDEADIYINGEADFVTEAPRSRAANAIADVKLSVPFFVNWKELQIFSPKFSLNAATVKGHNSNSMLFGLTWDSFTPLPWLIFRKNFLIESTTNFHVSDGVFAPTLRFPIPSRWIRPFAIVPFVGGEFGGNISSPFSLAGGAPIARGIFGADITAFFHLERTRLGLKGIGFEGQWLRRVLAEPETRVNEFAPGNYALAAFDQRPRDRAFVKLKFALTNTFGFSVSYENGQLPPSYPFVHNLVKIGLLYQAQVKARP